jgi:hypothetical protein
MITGQLSSLFAGELCERVPPGIFACKFVTKSEYLNKFFKSIEFGVRLPEERALFPSCQLWQLFGSTYRTRRQPHHFTTSLQYSRARALNRCESPHSLSHPAFPLAVLQRQSMNTSGT